MSDTATRAVEALDELRAELAHADTLIADQQARIDALEAEVAELRTKR
jgi:uncharacterized protein YceH (UPF0502 family)